jgi:hypothetical protein
LEVERTNPFFNEVGEQTLPVTLPDSDHNRAILGYPDASANRQKPSQNIDATIQDGEYFTSCRQAILGAKRKEGIETTFYMNEGAFFAGIPDMRLKKIFGKETIPGISTIQQGISFCRNLLLNGHDIYAIFPVLTKGDNDTTGYLNRIELMQPETGDYRPSKNNYSGFSYLGFYNEYERTEQDGDYTISIPIGCYITPFIRVNYVLRRMFTYFGYILEETFFEKTHPFTDMVFINNTDDTLLNGDIRLTDLIPDITCSRLLNVFRKRFCCEFIPDEFNKTVKIVFLKNILSGRATTDLTGCVDGEISLSFPGKYKQLKISSKDSSFDESEYDCVADIVERYPDIFQESNSGNYCRSAIALDTETGLKLKKNEVISYSNVPYYAGDDKEDVSIEVPDCAVVMRDPVYKNSEDKIITGVDPDLKLAMRRIYPYIGETQSLNSTLIYFDKENTAEDNTTTSENKEQSPMLAFAYLLGNDSVGSFYLGTIHSYDLRRQRIFNYSLLYNGTDGIFENFYRPYDSMLRNSMHTIKANLLLSQHQKLTIQAYQKVILDRQELLINKLAFTIGGKNEPQESEFFTLRLHELIDVAQDSGLMPVYHESSRFARFSESYVLLTPIQYELSPYKTGTMPTMYSLVFNEIALEDRGKLIWERKFAVLAKKNPLEYRLYTIRLLYPL